MGLEQPGHRYNVAIAPPGYCHLPPHKEDSSLKLLTPVPEEKLASWLKEFYGKDIPIARRQVLRHRDFSYVERLCFEDALPDSLIYKLVLPPWDIEQDLHQRVLIPSISASAQLFMTAHHGDLTAMFLEDLGAVYLKDQAEGDDAAKLGEELAKMHRAYSYRVDELIPLKILRTITPIDFEPFARGLAGSLIEWGNIDGALESSLTAIAGRVAEALAGEPISLVHGDLYAENIVRRGSKFFIIDWSWFTIIGVPLLDLASITSDHDKNGALKEHRNLVIEAYCDESGYRRDAIERSLPYAQAFERLLFLDWLVERKRRGVTGTTVGHVDGLIERIVGAITEIGARLD